MVDSALNFVLEKTMSDFILLLVIVLIVIAWKIGFIKILYWLITKAMEE